MPAVERQRYWADSRGGCSLQVSVFYGRTLETKPRFGSESSAPGDILGWHKPGCQPNQAALCMHKICVKSILTIHIIYIISIIHDIYIYIDMFTIVHSFIILYYVYLLITFKEAYTVQSICSNDLHLESGNCNSLIWLGNAAPFSRSQRILFVGAQLSQRKSNLRIHHQLGVPWDPPALAEMVRSEVCSVLEAELWRSASCGGGFWWWSCFSRAQTTQSVLERVLLWNAGCVHRNCWEVCSIIVSQQGALEFFMDCKSYHLRTSPLSLYLGAQLIRTLISDQMWWAFTQDVMSEYVGYNFFAQKVSTNHERINQVQSHNRKLAWDILNDMLSHYKNVRT